ncbi:ecto-ADP-ribosyltransferase 4 [Danio aesculapii]|uniref:ecto-ADP-ribosyltransferase 4 n=1 Tax=Danio aesculapii TaxID=1142201 RepID=UPI0024C077F2|nr:ecto-ADP-ribosyltransferase 4 [Danio aesculapii]
MKMKIEALLLILAALQDHSAAAPVRTIYPLDMALNSVDDQYKGCTETMTNKTENYYLPKERSASAEFNKTWQDGEANAKKPEDNLTMNHSVALYVYTNKDSSVYSDFTKATRTEKQAYINGTFKWYSLHFLLTEAVQILKKTQPRCFLTYRGTNLQFEAQGKVVRLSSFSSSSLNRTVIQAFGNVSCFEIYTCEGANLTKYSKYPEEKEVLIPPYETFNVAAVKNRTNEKDLWCETVFVLNSTGTRSDLNCALMNSGRHASFSNVLLIMSILFLYFNL